MVLKQLCEVYQGYVRGDDTNKSDRVWRMYIIDLINWTVDSCLIARSLIYWLRRIVDGYPGDVSPTWGDTTL